MKPSRIAALLLGALLLATAAPAADLAIGATAPDFTLPAAGDGKPVALKELLKATKAASVLRGVTVS